MPERVDRFIEYGAVKVETQDDLAALALFLDRRIERAEQTDPGLMTEADTVAGLQSFGGAHECPPTLRSKALDQGRFDLNRNTVSLARSEQARRDDLGVVDNQKIAFAQHMRQVAHRAVFEFGRCIRMHDQELRGIARVRRTQRNRILRQLEIE